MDKKQLDKLIAKHAMGWTLVEESSPIDNRLVEFYIDEDGELVGADTKSFNPSTSIVYAEMAMNKVSHDKKWRFIIDYKAGYVEATGKTGMGAAVDMLGLASNLPLAITLAILDGYGIIDYEEQEKIREGIDGDLYENV